MCRSAESYINKLATPPTHYYRQKLSRLLEAHPHLVNQLSEDEDSQEVGGDSEDDYLSSASSEGEEEEEEEEKGVAGGGVAVIPPQRCTRSASAVSRGKSQVCMCVCCVVEPFIKDTPDVRTHPGSIEHKILFPNGGHYRGVPLLSFSTLR